MNIITETQRQTLDDARKHLRQYDGPVADWAGDGSCFLSYVDNVEHALTHGHSRQDKQCARALNSSLEDYAKVQWRAVEQWAGLWRGINQTSTSSR